MTVASPKILIPVCLATVFLAACATRPLTYDDNLVVPGERVGEIEIGMKLSTLLALKGTPQKTAPIADTNATSYAFDGLTVGADDKVYWIIAAEPQFHTRDGIAPGAEQIVARAAAGKPRCVVTRGGVTVYDYGDFYFEVDNGTGKVKQLGVMKKTQTCDT